ncbi:hypothetical protein Barb7_01630 [Bacteroidales bacterium Barb7]|nr:hypothetical protein Barb7_01630 [Bacteroidales bacterium Barb7]
MQELGVESAERLLLVGQLAAVEGMVVDPVADSFHAPVVVDGGSSVHATEALFVHAALAQFLSAIDHDRVGVHGGGDNHGGDGGKRASGEEIGGDALLVVVFEEVQHTVLYVFQTLPATGDAGSGSLSADNGTKGIVKSHFIIKIVELPRMDIVPVFIRIIDFGNEQNAVPLLNLRDDPLPKLNGHHLRHIATEGINAFPRPEAENIQHFQPCIGQRVKVAGAAMDIINAVVQFDSLVPVISPRLGRKAVVAGCLGGKFAVCKMLLLFVVEMQCQCTFRHIIEIVAGVKSLACVVMFAEVGNKRALGVRMVLAGYVVGHKVDDNLHACLVRPLNQLFKLLHTVGNTVGKCRIYVVVILDGVGRACRAFHYAAVVFADAVSREIGLGGMFDNAGVPDVGNAQLLYLRQSQSGKGREFARAVFRHIPIADKPLVQVSKQAGEHLINNYFVFVLHV